MAKVKCMFDCRPCGLLRAEVFVEERDPTRNVVAWLDEVVRPAVARRHRELSKYCNARTADIYLPAGGDYIGQPATPSPPSPEVCGGPGGPVSTIDRPPDDKKDGGSPEEVT